MRGNPVVRVGVSLGRRVLLLVVLLGAGGCDTAADRHLSPQIQGADRSELVKRLEALEADAVLALHGEEVLVSWGAVDQRLNVASVRKSLVSALYGIAVERGEIDLDATLAALGVNERTMPLTPVEAGATVRHLLQARSGVYLPASGESPGMKERRPARGSSGPGETFYYNNWDFNALGSIFERQTGLTLGAAFERWIAAPTGMQDFVAADVEYQLEDFTEHAMYRFYMTPRDLLRFGALYANGGRWNGVQVIPEPWIAASFTAYSAVPYSDRADGYGFLWWIDSTTGRFLAEGSGGQFVIVHPASGLVVVSCNDTTLNLLGLRLHNPFAAVAPFAQTGAVWTLLSQNRAHRL